MALKLYIATSVGPSPHLEWRELACHDGTPYPLEWRGQRAVVLGGVFEAIRTACGGHPITVVSGYRTPAYNAACPGAAKGSQHVRGRALDLRPPDGLSVDEFHAIIVALARTTPEIGGVGHYDSFVHIDTRPRPVDGHLAQWDLRSNKDSDSNGPLPAEH